MVQEDRATMPAGSLAGGVSRSRPDRVVPRTRGESAGALANAVLSHLPLAVAVVDADTRLVFWNEQSACLFGAPSLKAADKPALADVLAGVGNLTPNQRDRIVSFSATHIAAGDRAGPESCLRILLARDQRITVQVRGIGRGRWMLLIDDDKSAFAAGRASAAQAQGDAWLDPLTGLSNRRHFNQVLRDLVDNASSDARHTLLMIDLDRFKPINDTLGHPTGDALLCLVARRLRRETRDGDLVVRLGGDEFVILLPGGERAEPLASRLIDVLSRPFLVEGQIANISASVGISHFPEHGSSADDLMRHADLALYDAKSVGGRAWRVFEPVMAAQARAKRELETDLRKALTLGELSLAYQAQFNVQKQVLTGFEALLRWNHPTRGTVPPGLFIPIAEEIGCILALGDWVVKTACNEAARWPAPLSVAVNVSPRQLEDRDRLFNTVVAALKGSGLAPERLELEITESSLLAQDGHVADTLHRLRGLGIRIAMDDFGTGYSSLSQLRSFPFSKIKIDRSFVSGLGLDGEATGLIRAIAALGAGLGMTTIAEGVETAEQAALVQADGCTDIQGYLISRPIPAAEIDALLGQYAPAADNILTTA